MKRGGLGDRQRRRQRSWAGSLTSSDSHLIGTDGRSQCALEKDVVNRVLRTTLRLGEALPAFALLGPQSERQPQLRIKVKTKCRLRTAVGVPEDGAIAGRRLIDRQKGLGGSSARCGVPGPPPVRRQRCGATRSITVWARAIRRAPAVCSVRFTTD